jgi:predicted  nucleic acid-binding Zn-ribbon protein
LRLAGIANVRLEQVDSRRFLRELLDTNLLPAGPTFFYLDAHWQDDLPLWEEIDLIFSRHPAPVIMVDDFRVPADTGFAYDDYGKGKCLSVSDLHASVSVRPSLFFPNQGSTRETGAQRGCVVLAQGDIARAIANDVPMLTELSRPDALILDGMIELSKERSQLETIIRERDELRQACATNEAQLLSLSDSLKTLDTERAALRNALDEADVKCDALTNSLREVNANCVTLEDALKKSIADHESLSASLRFVEGERDRIIVERDTILTSTSWRVTAPLRKMRTNLSRRSP